MRHEKPTSVCTSMRSFIERSRIKKNYKFSKNSRNNILTAKLHLFTGVPRRFMYKFYNKLLLVSSLSAFSGFSGRRLFLLHTTTRNRFEQPEKRQTKYLMTIEFQEDFVGCRLWNEL